MNDLIVENMTLDILENILVHFHSCLCKTFVNRRYSFQPDMKSLKKNGSIFQMKSKVNYENKQTKRREDF